MAVRAGRLRHRLELWKLAGTKDKFGSITNEKVRVGTYWCNIENTKNETVGTDVRQNQNSISFITRYNGVEYDINSVLNPRFLNERLVIECVARGN